MPHKSMIRTVGIKLNEGNVKGDEIDADLELDDDTTALVVFYEPFEASLG